MGQARLDRLADAGVRTILDMLAILPKSYRDFSAFTPISKLVPGSNVAVKGRLLSLNKGLTWKKRIPFLECLLDDGSGAVRLLWYRSLFLAQTLEKGGTFVAKGVVKRDTLGMSMVQPAVDLACENQNSMGIETVYPQLAGLAGALLGNWVGELLDQEFKEPSLAKALLDDSTMTLKKAFVTLHRPEHLDEKTGLPTLYNQALNYLKVLEFYEFQKRLQSLASQSQKRRHPRVQIAISQFQEFVATLPFELTGDQDKVAREIMDQINQDQRLVGLVQGDVGSGKTVVALLVAYLFIKAGYQVAFMAPTTLLAKQHYQNAKHLLNSLGVEVDWLSGAREAEENNRVLARLRAGTLTMVIGTHKLFQEKVVFANLGLVLIDEQHRFGVGQRSALLKKGLAPHYLAFTATPIPRSLAMTLYGGFKVFQLKEKPKTRVPIRTILKLEKNLEEILKFLDQRLKKGEAVYWVTPAIDPESQKEAASAVERFQWFAKKPPYQKLVGLVHGQLTKSELASTMTRFSDGDLQILVATSVIEVGIDVTRATVMVIEDAHFFGLSQLHQLRGRVGRGSQQSFCFLLVPDDVPIDSRKRLRLLESSEDGFFLAESDLAQRGAGHLLGKAQSGKPEFRFGDPWEDQNLMKKVCKVLTAEKGKEEVQW